MCGVLELPTTVTVDMYKKGFRLVDGKIVHLTQMFPTRAAKLEAFIKQIPCTGKYERVRLLLKGKENVAQTLHLLELSIRMLKVAEAELSKRRRGITKWFSLSKHGKLDGLQQMFVQLDLRSDNLLTKWTDAYDEAHGKDPSKMALSKNVLIQYIHRCAAAPRSSKIDDYLPNRDQSRQS